MSVVGDLLLHEMSEAVKVIWVQLYVVVSGALKTKNYNFHGTAVGQLVIPYLDPKRIDGPGTFFVDCEAVREVNDLVLGAMDHKNWRRNF